MADLKLIADSGGGTVSLKAPAATTSNAAVTLKLPVADGSANQLLKTDGSGQLGWATDSTGLSSDAQKNTVGGTNAGDSFSGTSAEENTLIGYDAGTDISSGDANTVLGAYAGKDIDTGHSNTFIGRRAGHQNTSGQESVAIGAYSLAEVTTASHNTSIGNMALRFCGSGQYNSCSGQSAGYNITSGSDNVCIGHGAGNSTNWSNSTSLTTGSNNILIGKFAVPSANNVSNEITLGNSSITKFRVPGLNFTVKDTTATEDYVLTVDANGEAGWEAAAGGAGGATGIDFNDNVKARWGTGNDSEIYFDGTDTFIKHTPANGSLVLHNNATTPLFLDSDIVQFRNKAQSETQFKATANGGVELYYDNSKKFETTSQGCDIGFSNGNVRFMAANGSSNIYINVGNSELKMWDNSKIVMGAGSDLSIYHDGSNSYIKNDTAGLFIQGGTQNNSIYIRPRDGENSIQANSNSSVELYYDNSKKFETLNNGVKSHGRVQVLDGNSFVAGDGDDFRLLHNGTNSFIINDTGELQFQANDVRFYTSGASETHAKFINNGAVELYHNNIKTFSTDGNGIFALGPEGGNANVYIYADEGDDDADKWSITADPSVSILTINNRLSGAFEKSIECNGNGNVELYYDNSKKLETTSSGVLVSDSSGSADAVLKIEAEGGQDAYLALDTSNGGGATADVRFQMDGTTKGSIEYANAGSNVNCMLFRTNDNSEKVRIAADGKVGIGETSPSVLLNLKGTADGGATGIKIVADADTYSQLTLDGNRSSAGNACGIIAGRWNANDVCSIYLISGSDTTNKDDGQLGFYTTPSGGSSSRRLLLNENGVWYGSLYDTNTNAGLSANVFVFSNDSMGRASSSGKYKKNIETIQDSYADKILTMRPAWYQQDETTVNIPEDQGDNWGYWGFIAEEVAAIDPRLVTWKVANYATDPSDKTKTIRTPLSEPEPDNVAYDRFVPHLVNLLKRQATKIEALETKVTALEAS